jgi:hypothetical protein
MNEMLNRLLLILVSTKKRLNHGPNLFRECLPSFSWLCSVDSHQPNYAD